MVTVGDARDAFRARHRELIAAQSGAFTLRLGPLRLALPNPGHLDLHDMHHVALGAPPDVLGEIQVGAFEVCSGFPTAYIGLFDVAAVLLGLLCFPRRTIAWLRAYRRCGSFYGERARYDQWLARPVEDLFDFLRLAPPARAIANSETATAEGDDGAPAVRHEQPSSSPPSSTASPPPSPALPLPLPLPFPAPLPDPGPEAASAPPEPAGDPEPLPPEPAPGPAPGPTVAAVAVTVGSPGSVPVPNS